MAERDRDRQIEELFHTALKLEPTRRAAFLSSKCGSDARLRSEIENLIAAHEKTGSFLDSPAHQMEAALIENGGVAQAGTVIGHYEVAELLGRGGMGEVYRARDSRLNRSVAIKLISSDIASETARQRFRQEARMASALNHPHILTVHDAGEFEGQQYLVTEFIDGGTVRQWALEKKPNWRQIADLLVGVGDGLACAHEAGILHRDIKPDNILVSKSGYAKLADFGLAKLAEKTPDQQTSAPTVVRTGPGVIIGTVAYMSPEQASGKSLDARSDIFSFGVVLYELVSGRKPFEGATELETLQTIISGTPKPLNDALPVMLRSLVEKALEKDPGDRYQSMRELVVDLRRAGRQSENGPQVQVDGGSQTRAGSTWKSKVLVSFGVLAVVGVTLWLLMSRRSATPAGPPHQDYVQLTSFADSATSPALSSDGRMLTFIRGDSTFVALGEIYVQLLPNGEPVQITHDGGQKMSPVFSPDGSRIAYTVLGEGNDWSTWTIPSLGGTPQRFFTSAEGLNWIPSGTSARHVLFSELTGEGLHMAVATATENRLESRRVYVPPNPVGMAHRSSLSPDGKWVLVVEMLSGWLPCRVVPYDGSNLGRTVGPNGAPCTNAVWSPDGSWIYVSANSGNGFHIWRQKFPVGEPEQVTTGVTEEEGIAFAPDGKSFVTSIGTDQNTIWIHDSTGDRQVTSQGYAYQPTFSPDGKRLFYMLRSGASTQTWVKGALWVVDLKSGARERLLSDFQMLDYDISPDGTQIVFSAVEDSQLGRLWIGPVDGSIAPHRLAGAVSGRAVFARSGEVFFTQNGILYRINADGSGQQKVMDGRVNYLYAVSPDGNWAAAWEAPAVRIYPLHGGPAIELCATCGTIGADRKGITPPLLQWSRNGKFLYLHFASTTRETFVVPLQHGQVLPPLPKDGISSAQMATIPGAIRIPQLRAFVSGDDPTVYAFMRQTPQRNIYRVPVP